MREYINTQNTLSNCQSLPTNIRYTFAQLIINTAFICRRKSRIITRSQTFMIFNTAYLYIMSIISVITSIIIVISVMNDLIWRKEMKNQNFVTLFWKNVKCILPTIFSFSICWTYAIIRNVRNVNHTNTNN